jgi:hypothetical protein
LGATAMTDLGSVAWHQDGLRRTLPLAERQHVQ